MSSDDDWSKSSDDESDSPRLAAGDVLSTDVLAALMEFQSTGGFEGEDPQEISKEAICATFTPGDSQMIAATYRRLQEKEEQAGARYAEALNKRVMLDFEAPEGDLATALVEKGVVRVNGVLDGDMCDLCLDHINQALLLAGSPSDVGDTSPAMMEDSYENQEETGANTTAGFGNVFSRKNRYDMYLRNTGVYETALASMLGSDKALGRLFDTVLQGETGVFHEFSSLVSDPGSASQPIHPDSPFAQHAPMWTVFCALQDIDATMGPTVFLPGTNSLDCHERLKSPEDRVDLLASSEYRRGVLKKGDCAVMDSRTFHFGDANESERRRVLFYFTIRNPKHQGEYPPCGSLFPDLGMTIKDYY